ncbi:MAG: hypothetical protein RL153_2266, partial [Verrucomicrobiota bacterium]
MAQKGHDPSINGRMNFKFRGDS